MRPFIALVLGSVVTAGCSLSGVAEFDLPQCTSDAECREAFNAENGLYAECAAFACKQGACERIAEEVCDGQDNDCDYLVDEPNDSVSPIAPELEELSKGVTTALTAASVTSSGVDALYVQGDEGASFFNLKDAGTTGSVSLFTNRDDVKDVGLEEGCRVPGGGIAGCSVGRLAVASGEQLGFFAEVATNGCASGALRVGVIDPEHPEQLIDRGPGFRSPSSWGVRATLARCTNNGTAACEAAASALEASGVEEDRQAVIDACGVTEPSIAALDDQALVTFVAEGDNRATCGGAVADVQALLVHERIGIFGAPFAWGDPSGDGVPDVIGKTRGGSEPSLVALDRDGFVVAHGTDTGALRLAWVPRQAPPPSNAGTTCPDAGCESRDGVSTSALSQIAELDIVDAEEAHAVALSWLPLSAEGKQHRSGALAVAWLDGCDSSAEAKLRVVRTRWVDGSFELFSPGPVVSLGPSSERPVLLSASSGFVAAGFQRDGAVATSEETGGFYAVTHTSAGPVAARVTAFDGAEVAENERISLGNDRELRVIGITQTAEATFVAHSSENERLSLGTLSCR